MKIKIKKNIKYNKMIKKKVNLGVTFTFVLYFMLYSYICYQIYVRKVITVHLQSIKF